MAMYKYLGPDRSTGVDKDSMNIPANEDNRDWKEFLEWEALGNTADPWKTPEELHEMALASKLTELDVEYTDQVEMATGITGYSKITRDNSKHLKALRKEAKGSASQDDIDYLDAKDILDDRLDYLDVTNDDAERWLEDVARTTEEINDYDVTVDPGWEE